MEMQMACNGFIAVGPFLGPRQGYGLEKKKTFLGS